MTRRELAQIVEQLKEWLDKGAEGEAEISVTMPLESSRLAYDPTDFRQGFAVNPVRRKFDLVVRVEGYDIDMNPRFM